VLERAVVVERTTCPEEIPTALLFLLDFACR
jgi:hypothetical protein